MKWLILLLVLIVLFLLAGCGDELAAAKASASFWKTAAIMGCLLALLIGVAMGSRDKS